MTAYRPFTVSLRRRPLPSGLFPGPISGFRSLHLDLLFRPRGFAPPRRLPPPPACGLVASRSRSWGSPRFLYRSSESDGTEVPRIRRRDISRDARTPLEEVPVHTAVQRHRCRSRRGVFWISRSGSPSRSVSVRTSVALESRFQNSEALSFHGLSSLSRFPGFRPGDP